MSAVRYKHDDLGKLSPGRILGIDFGHKRIGCALCDPSQVLAVPFKTIANQGRKHLIEQIREIREEYDVIAIVVGMPFHMNGMAGERAQEVGRLIDDIIAAVDIPVFTWDERWTTKSAEKFLKQSGQSPSKNRAKIDQIAAAIILDGFLNRLNYIRRQDSRNGE